MALKNRIRKFAAPLLGGAVLAAGITGAGFTQVFAATSTDSTTVTQVSTNDSTVTPADTTKDTTSDTGTQNGDSSADDAALAAKATVTADEAAKTAADANSGYTVIINHLEDENGTVLYEIKMADTTGNKLEVKVDAAAGTILSSEPYTGDMGKGIRDGSTSEDDAALAAKATVTAEAAAKTAADANSGYTVIINHLEDENGTILYEIKMADTAGNKLEVKVDAAVGTILSSEPYTGDMGGKTGKHEGKDNDSTSTAADASAADASTTETTAVQS